MALSGNEVLYVIGVQPNGSLAATTEQTTTGQIASLASSETSFVSTNITTVGNGTLTGTALAGSQIIRTGPVAAFSDATDTAAAIIAAFPGGIAAGSNTILIKNATAFTQTITAGSNVTLPPTIIIPPYSVGRYVITPTSATAVTFVHINTTEISVGQNVTAPLINALATVGNGTLLAVNFSAGLTARTGPVAAFTDTTDTAAAIIAACANLVNKIGTSFIYYYANSSAFVGTVTGGSGVTVSGVTIVPPNTIAAYLVTYTAAATLTMVGLGVTQTLSTAVTIAGSSTGATALLGQAAAQGQVALPAFATGTDTLTAGATQVVSATANFVSNVTLTNLSGIAINLSNSGVYSFLGEFPMSSPASGGVKFALNTTNSLALVSLNMTAKLFASNGSPLILNTTTSAFGTSLGSSGAYSLAELVGAFQVNTAGVLNVQAAQSLSNATSTQIFQNGFMQVTRIS